MAKLKTDGVFIRMTPQLKELFQKIAKDKAMSQTNLIEYLIRKEAEKNP